MATPRTFTRSLANLATCALAALVICLSAEAQSRMIVPVPPSLQIDFSQVPGGLKGRSVDISGNRILLGARETALIFEETSPDNWTFVQRLVIPIDTEDGGISVGISGDLAVVAAPYDFLDTDFGEGGAILYSLNQGSWGFDLNLQIGTPGSLFGANVALSGNTTLISGQGLPPHGRVYFFEHDGNQWNSVLVSTGLSPPSPASTIGGDVSISGDIAAVTNRFHATEQIVVYRRTGSVWAEDQGINLNIPELANIDFTNVGFNVAIDGNTLISQVEVPLSNPQFRFGVAVFVDQGSGFVFQQVLEPQDGNSGQSRFGTALAIHGDQIIIGAYKDAPWGAAYSFRRDTPNGMFTERAKYVPIGGEYTPLPGFTFSPKFGFSVALSATKTVIGAPGDNGFGTAYVVPNVQLASTVRGFCFGDGGFTPGCTNCPCGNNADAGMVGGCLNSAGSSAALAVTGQASVSNDTARLEAGRAMPSTMMLLASSAKVLPLNPGISPCPSGSGVRSNLYDGLRCLGGPIVRHGLRVTDATGAVEGPNDGWGGQFRPTGGLVNQGAFATGQKRYFQAIYRDNMALGCNTGINTTNAVSIQVVP